MSTTSIRVGDFTFQLMTEMRQTATTLLEAAGFISYFSTAWLGATDLVEETVWRWLSNNDLAEIPEDWWNPSYPYDYDKGENCLAMRSQTLHDRACVMSYNSICQKNIDNPCDDVLPGAEYCTGSCFKAV
ncbi:hypothetical protein RRG08_025164 [Elysia crispata]|uniref:C-type lectin domain-containing protein n=1 Tax=Elysia crispata TaxID=231223 RepID=A0AAE1ATE8_9GAST|nr:hypothetical protein RRG08_025164 [Elysia crispata]